MVFKYPYTDMYALNLDWMLQAIKEVQEIIEALGSVVHTFNNREGNVELLPADVNGLNINILHRLGPGVAFNSLSQAQLKTLYDSGVRIVVAQNQQGIFYRQYLLLNVGGTITGTEFLPVPGETQVLSFNERTGDIELLASDVNDLHINFVYPILDAMSGHTADFKTWYNAGIRFVQEKVDGVENWYYLTSSGDRDEQTVTATIYDPLKGRGLVKSVEGNTPNANGAVLIPEMVKKVNSKSPVNGNVYVYGTDIDMANDDDTSVESAIKTNSESIGTLSSLKTTAKNNLVAAVNESVDYVRGVSGTYPSETTYDVACQTWVDSLPNDSCIHYGMIFKTGYVLVIAQKYSSSAYASYIAFGYNKEVIYQYKTNGIWISLRYLNNAPQIAPPQLSDIATQNIPKDSYFIWNNLLCKAKSTIPLDSPISASNTQSIPEGGLNAIKDDYSTTTATITLGGATGTMTFEKHNKIVYFKGAVSDTDFVNNPLSSTIIGTIPEGYRPKIEHTQPGVSFRSQAVWLNAAYSFGLIWTSATGDMNINATPADIQNKTHVTIEGSYICA